MQINFDNFVKVSKKFYKNYKEINRLKKDIEHLIPNYEIRVWENYLFKVGKSNGDFTTKDIKFFEELLGSKFNFGGRNYTKYLIENNNEGHEKIIRLKNLIAKQKELASHIKNMSHTQYPTAVLCGKVRNLETFTSSCWGFRVRELDKDLSLKDIMDIEKETGSIFIERNTYGCDFRFEVK